MEQEYQFNVEEKEVLRLLGYKEVPVEQKILEEVRSEIIHSKSYVRPRAKYERYKITKWDKDRIRLENNIVLQGDYIADRLKDCQDIVMVVCTLGKEIDEKIQDAFEKGNYFKGMIIDCIGLNGLEYVNKIVWKQLMKDLVESNMGITSKISPGDTKWDLSEQKKIFNGVKPTSIGVALNESNMMIPMKSTSSIYGFGEGIGSTSSGYVCMECSMKDCLYREARK